VSGATIEWEGKSATFNFLTDITERKITEQEVNLKNDQLIRLNAEKDKLFSIIAHDLRGPFSSFMDYMEIMVEDLYDMSIQEIQEMAGEMKKSSYNLYTLLENLLEWSRVQSGITSYVHSVFELKPMITDTMALVVQAAAKKEIEITLEIPEYIKVDADENMLKSIVRNLASNAVKFTRRGGKITLEATLLNEGFVEIRIKDSGIGMNAGIIEKLFTLNKKISRNGTEGELSTGLGLLLCKDFVEKHGGRIWADSVEGRGSIFHFTIPSA
jgi:signal transduction histidine kinase